MSKSPKKNMSFDSFVALLPSCPSPTIASPKTPPVQPDRGSPRAGNLGANPSPSRAGMGCSVIHPMFFLFVH